MFPLYEVKSSKKPKLVTKYGLHHTWEHTWPIRNGTEPCAPKYGLHHTWEHTWLLRNGSHVHDVHVQRRDCVETRATERLRFTDWLLFLQVVYYVNKFEAMFPTERLKISKCTWIKLLLDTNFASSVKPTNMINFS